MINTFDVDEPNILSDHCVVIFSLWSHRVNQTINIEDNPETCKYRYVWNNEHIIAYQNALVSENVKIELQSLTSELLTAESEDVLNSNLSMFQNTLGPINIDGSEKTL